MSDGYTLRDHLQAEARQTGRPDADLLAAPPHGTEVLWGAYVALAGSRQMGQSAIPASEILAHQQLHGIRFSGWEVDTLQALARATAAVSAAQRPAPKPRKATS